MPTGKAVEYKRLTQEELKGGYQLDPPADAYRVYVACEQGLVRWAYSSEQAIPSNPHIGFPLFGGDTDEFDTDLAHLQLWSGALDTIAHLYYFGSA